MSTPNKIYEFHVNGNENLFIVPPDPIDALYEDDNKYYNELLKEKEWTIQYEKQTGK